MRSFVSGPVLLTGALLFSAVQVTLAISNGLENGSETLAVHRPVIEHGVDCLSSCRKLFGHLKRNVIFPGVPSRKEIEEYQDEQEGVIGDVRSLLIPEESALPIAIFPSAEATFSKKRRFKNARLRTRKARRRLKKRIKKACTDSCRPKLTAGYFCYCIRTVCVPDLGFKCLCTEHRCKKE